MSQISPRNLRPASEILYSWLLTDFQLQPPWEVVMNWWFLSIGHPGSLRSFQFTISSLTFSASLSRLTEAKQAIVRNNETRRLIISIYLGLLWSCWGKINLWPKESNFDCVSTMRVYRDGTDFQMLFFKKIIAIVFYVDH